MADGRPTAAQKAEARLSVARAKRCLCSGFRNRCAPCGVCGAPAPALERDPADDINISIGPDRVIVDGQVFLPVQEQGSDVPRFIRCTAERRFGPLGDETAWEAFRSQGT